MLKISGESSSIPLSSSTLYSLADRVDQQPALLDAAVAAQPPRAIAIPTSTTPSTTTLAPVSNGR